MWSSRLSCSLPSCAKSRGVGSAFCSAAKSPTLAMHAELPGARGEPMVWLGGFLFYYPTTKPSGLRTEAYPRTRTWVTPNKWFQQPNQEHGVTPIHQLRLVQVSLLMAWFGLDRATFGTHLVWIHTSKLEAWHQTCGQTPRPLLAPAATKRMLQQRLHVIKELVRVGFIGGMLRFLPLDGHGSCKGNCNPNKIRAPFLFGGWAWFGKLLCGPAWVQGPWSPLSPPAAAPVAQPDLSDLSGPADGRPLLVGQSKENVGKGSTRACSCFCPRYLLQRVPLQNMDEGETRNERNVSAGRKHGWVKAQDSGFP